MKITSRQLCEGCKIPFGFGLAYRDVFHQMNIYYLFPLNLIIAFFRNLYVNMLFFWPQKLDALKKKFEASEIYEKGYQKGLEEGKTIIREIAYQEGFKEGQQSILEICKKYFKANIVTEETKEKK